MTTKNVRIRRAIVHALLHAGSSQFAHEVVESADEVNRWVSHGGPLPPCLLRELERDNAQRQVAAEV